MSKYLCSAAIICLSFLAENVFGSELYEAFSIDNYNYYAFEADNRIIYTINEPIRGGFSDNLYVERFPNGAKTLLGNHAGEYQYRVSPTEDFVVYQSNFSRTSGDLYLVSVNGGNPKKINTAFTPFHWRPHILSFSSNGKHFVYNHNNSVGLFSVAVAGGSTRRLDLGGSHKNVSISPDSKRVLYIGSHDGSGVANLFSADIDGRENIKLNHSLDDDDDVQGYLISPDGSKVVYSTRQPFQRFIVPTSGGAPVRIINESAILRHSSFTNDSQYLVYAVESNLYSVHVSSGQSVLLSDNYSGQCRASCVYHEDSKVFFFKSTSGGGGDWFSTRVDGSGETQELPSSEIERLRDLRKRQEIVNRVEMTGIVEDLRDKLGVRDQVYVSPLNLDPLGERGMHIFTLDGYTPSVGFFDLVYSRPFALLSDTGETVSLAPEGAEDSSISNELKIVDGPDNSIFLTYQLYRSKIGGSYAVKIQQGEDAEVCFPVKTQRLTYGTVCF